MGKLPLFSVDLMKLFDNLHPYRRPCIDIADRLIWFDTVAWLVANMRVALLKDSEENSLSDAMKRG